MENDFNNVAGTIALKSLSIVIIFLKVFKEFRDNFPDNLWQL